ncbi:MAG TPA: hypothetical protein VFV55_00040 [Usitatibacteraceae bacterium]|nr:hypothetical protein [Usitatibacteraceae bacterium]
MNTTVAIALLATAGALTGCASSDPKAGVPAAAPHASAAASAEEFKTGSRLQRRAPESQPVKSIGREEWKNVVADKPQPMPAGN